MEHKKIVAEFDCFRPDDLSPEQFVKLMADYILLCRFVTNVHRVDALDINTKVNIHFIAIPKEIVN